MKTATALEREQFSVVQATKEETASFTPSLSMQREGEIASTEKGFILVNRVRAIVRCHQQRWRKEPFTVVQATKEETTSFTPSISMQRKREMGDVALAGKGFILGNRARYVVRYWETLIDVSATIFLLPTQRSQLKSNVF